MSHHPRRTAPLLLMPALAIVIAACTAAGGGASAPTSGQSGAGHPCRAAPAADAIEHKTGATDILLRYEEGGGFIMPAFTAAAVPHFTLYGDGTVIFRNPMLEAPPAEGSIFKMNPLRTAKLSEEQVQELLRLALERRRPRRRPTRVPQRHGRGRRRRRSSRSRPAASRRPSPSTRSAWSRKA